MEHSRKNLTSVRDERLTYCLSLLPFLATGVYVQKQTSKISSKSALKATTIGPSAMAGETGERAYDQNAHCNSFLNTVLYSISR